MGKLLYVSDSWGQGGRGGGGGRGGYIFFKTALVVRCSLQLIKRVYGVMVKPTVL